MLKALFFLTALLFAVIIVLVWLTIFIKILTFVIPESLLCLILIFVFLLLYFSMMKPYMISPVIEQECTRFQSMLGKTPNPKQPRFVILPQKTFYSTEL